MRDLEREIRERARRIREPSEAELRHALARGPCEFGGGASGAMMGRRRTGVGLDLFAGGTFTRASSKTVQSSATTLSEYATNVRALEDRGDGRGQMLSVEPAHTNRSALSAPRAGWTAENSASYSALAVSGPLASLNAATLSLAASATSRILRALATVPADNTTLVLSAWVRVTTGTGTVRLGFRQKDGATFALGSDIAITTAWQRVSASVSVGAGGSTPAFVVCNGSDGVARNLEIAYLQAEQGLQWHQSYVDVPAAAAVATSVDVLTYGVGEYPASFLTNGFRLTFAPDFSSGEAGVLSTTALILVAGQSSAIDYIGFLTNGAGTLRMRLIRAGTERVAPAVTFSRGQLLTIEVRANQDTIVLSGFTTGNGTHSSGVAAAAWTSQTLAVGHRVSANQPSGRFGRWIEVL